MVLETSCIYTKGNLNEKCIYIYIYISGHEFNSHSEPTLYSYSNFMVCSVSHFISAIAFVSRYVCFNRNFVEAIIYIYNKFSNSSWTKLVGRHYVVALFLIWSCKFYIYTYIYIYVYTYIYNVVLSFLAKFISGGLELGQKWGLGCQKHYSLYAS